MTAHVATKLNRSHLITGEVALILPCLGRSDIDRQATFTYDGKNRAYGPPWNYRGTFPQLFHNEGSGRFVDVSARAGIQVTNQSGMPLAKMLVPGFNEVVRPRDFIAVCAALEGYMPTH